MRFLLILWAITILLSSIEAQENTCGEQNGIQILKKILILGETGVGKSALGNAIAQRNIFKSTQSKDSVTKTFSSHRILKGCSNEFEIIDSPGFTDVEKSNLEILNGISKKIKHEQIDYIVIMLKYGVRQSNQEFIFKWLKYCLPLQQQNSLVIINYVFEAMDLDFDEEETAKKNTQIMEDEINFIDYIKSIFVTSSYHQFNTFSNKSLMLREFSTLGNQIISQTLNSKIDHGQVFTLTQKLQREEVNVQLKCLEDLRPEYIQKYTNQINTIGDKLANIENMIIDLENELSEKQNQDKIRENQARIKERDILLSQYFQELSKMLENLMNIVSNPLNLFSFIKDIGSFFKTDEKQKDGSGVQKQEQPPKERTTFDIQYDLQKQRKVVNEMKSGYKKLKIELQNIDQVIKQEQMYKICYEENETLIDIRKLIKYFESLKN